MKKFTYSTYDLIRQDKFRTPEKITAVEKLLETNTCVINWWCRQSGKSLTSIKIARDLAIKQPSEIIFAAVNTAQSAEFKKLTSRCIDRDLVESENSREIRLKNKSIIKFITVDSAKHSLKNTDMLIFDEFEYMNTDFVTWLSEVNFTINPSLYKRFINMFNYEKPRLKVIFSSSKKDSKNFKLIKNIFTTAPVTYLNYEKVNYGPGKLDNIRENLSVEKFKTEYNSYFP